MGPEYPGKAVAGNRMRINNKKPPKFSALTFMVLLLAGLTCKVFSQGTLAWPAVRAALTGRISTGGTYFSNANSLSSQLDALSEALVLQYRVFDDSQKTRYLFNVDALAKEQFKGLADSLTANPARNGAWVREAYAGIGIRNGILKIGRITPLLETADPYSINGLSVEDLRLGPHLALSAFGGKINDDYSTTLIGEGYDAGGCLNFESALANAGVGFTAEDRLGFFHQNAFFSAAYTPFRGFRLSERTQGVIDEKRIAYSLTQLYWRINRDITVQSTFDYYDRTTTNAPPADTSPGISRYVFAAVERKFFLSPTLRILNSPDNTVDVSASFSRQVGGNDLTSGTAKVDYWDLRRNMDWVLDAGVMKSLWMHNYRAGLSFEKDIPDLRLDAVLSGDINDYAWNYQDSAGVAGSTNARIFFSASLAAGFNLLKNFRVWFTVNEELGDASSLRTSVSGRLTYLLR